MQLHWFQLSADVGDKRWYSQNCCVIFHLLAWKCLCWGCWWALEVQWVMHCQGNPRAGVFIMALQPLLLLASQADGSASQISDGTHGVHLLSRSSRSSSSSWSQRAARGMSEGTGDCGLSEQLLQGCWSHVQVQQPCSSHFLPVAGVLLLGSNSAQFCYRRRSMSSPLPLPLSGFPATAVTACAEMQVIYLKPASLAWWARLENWSDKVHTSSTQFFLQGLPCLVLEMLSLGSHYSFSLAGWYEV